jgi:aminocarboxymuconate-semialdehyde decarboxylase
MRTRSRANLRQRRSIQEVDLTNSSNQPGIIDVHCHLYPMEYIKLLEQRNFIPRVINKNGSREFLIFPEEDGLNGVGGRPMGSEYYDLDQKIKFMDKTDIQTSVVSLGNPWLDPFPDSTGDQAALIINQKMSEYEKATQGRITAMGVLPTSHVTKAIETLHQIASTKGLHGVVSGPRITGLVFDDPQLDPFWSELNQLGLPLFVHPENGVALELLEGYRHTLPVGIGFPVETTIALTRLIFGGILQKYPSLRILVAHGGGCLPYLAGRLDASWNSDAEVKSKLKESPSQYIQKLYLDALVYAGPALQAAYRLVGAQHLLFGTDQPFSVSDPDKNIKMLQTELQNKKDLDSVMHNNAVAFFDL